MIFFWMSWIDTRYAHQHEYLGTEHVHSLRISFSILITVLLSVLNTIAQYRWGINGFRYKVSFRKKLLLLFVQQFIFTAIAAVVLYSIVRFGIGLDVVADFPTFAERFNVFSFWIFAGIAAYVLEIIKAIDQKLGPGNLWKLMIGEFSQPKEMERIFMFLDLRSATALAERLGNIRYSQLLQDCFHDISIVQQYDAEVFQYVGDEVVLVWKTKEGLSSFNCIESYFAFMNQINEKSDYYKSKYGVIPFFKAGIHIGPVVLAEVGEIKREIAYHGDTINTASRIQGKCNELDQSLIVSDELITAFDQHDMVKKYAIERLGQVTLKGKDRSVKILGIKKAS